MPMQTHTMDLYRTAPGRHTANKTTEDFSQLIMEDIDQTTKPVQIILNKHELITKNPWTT